MHFYHIIVISFILLLHKTFGRESINSLKALWTALSELNFFPWKNLSKFPINGNLLDQAPESTVDVLDIPIEVLLIWQLSVVQWSSVALRQQ